MPDAMADRPATAGVSRPACSRPRQADQAAHSATLRLGPARERVTDPAGKGDEFVRWLRAFRANSKIVAVSAREVGNDALTVAGRPSAGAWRASSQGQPSTPVGSEFAA
jgi:hypothetical protein